MDQSTVLECKKFNFKGGHVMDRSLLFCSNESVEHIRCRIEAYLFNLKFFELINRNVGHLLLPCEYLSPFVNKPFNSNQHYSFYTGALRESKSGNSIILGIES